jgi:hypothetical protein
MVEHDRSRTHGSADETPYPGDLVFATGGYDSSAVTDIDRIGVCVSIVVERKLFPLTVYQRKG